MGKKSKQRKSNKVLPCYHGCTKKEFNNCGEYFKVLESYDKDNNTHEKRVEFREKNKRYMIDSIFGCFVIAHITDEYLKGNITTALLIERLFLLLDIRYCYLPQEEGKDIGPDSDYTRNFNKYSRDVHTERGRINLMAREIPCDCLEEQRIAAKSLAKVAMCYFCWNEFPKQAMLRCKGCELEQYCSQECSIKAWPEHKVYCYKNGVSSAPASALGSVSSVEEPADVDVDVDIDGE